MTTPNSSPPVDDFCAGLPGTFPPAIHIYGGALIQAHFDPKTGAGSKCGFSYDLFSKLEGLLAPIQPILTILDVVAQLATCFQLAVKAISNPLKIPDLLKCMPELVPKINALLALIPVFPQAIIEIATMVADSINAISIQIECIIDTLTSIQNTLADFEEMTAQAILIDDATSKNNLLELALCGRNTAETQMASAMSVLGPISRILCTLRTILVLTGVGKPIADAMSFNIPSGGLEEIDTVIKELHSLDSALRAVLSLLSDIAAPFGGLLPAPTDPYVCPLDQTTNAVTSVPVSTPILTDVTVPLFPFTTTPVVPATDPDILVTLKGQGFTASSVVYFDLTQVPSPPALPTLVNTPLPGTEMTVLLPASARLAPHVYKVRIVNEDTAHPNMTIVNGTASEVPSVPYGGLPDPTIPGQNNFASKTSESVDFGIV